jgi:peptide/nickel transport system permease protein
MQVKSPGGTRMRVSRRWRLDKESLGIGTIVALVLLVALVAVAVFAPLFAPYDPNAQSLRDRLLPLDLFSAHPLGTDDFGRDVLSRLIYGARVSVFAASEALAVSVLFGVPLGILAGYLGGRVDTALSRIFDGVMSIPALILALTFVAILGPGLVNVMFAVGCVFAPRYFRVARAVTLSVRRELYIEASVAIGCNATQVMTRHVIPNILPPLVVQGSIIVGMAVTAEASLSFLGLGVSPPTASWGGMLASAYPLVRQAPHLVWLPGLLITLTVLAFTMVGQRMSAAVTARSS